MERAAKTPWNQVAKTPWNQVAKTRGIRTKADVDLNVRLDAGQAWLDPNAYVGMLCRSTSSNTRRSAGVRESVINSTHFDFLR
jgi:hypothetical protein